MGAPEEDPSLVMAMPRRELFAIGGFVTRVSFDVLASLADESWFAVPATLVGNLDAKEVRLGLVITRRTPAGDEVLVGEAGTLVHTTPVPPEVARFGEGVRALRDLAAAAGATFVGSPCRVELTGYLNDDALPEIRDVFLLVYRGRVGDGSAAPAGTAWIPATGLADTPLDPVSSVVCGGLFTTEARRAAAG